MKLNLKKLLKELKHCDLKCEYVLEEKDKDKLYCEKYKRDVIKNQVCFDEYNWEDLK